MRTGNQRNTRPAGKILKSWSVESPTVELSTVEVYGPTIHTQQEMRFLLALLSK